ncbi:DUF397 domain-containing protein [Streptomyces sp. ME19-01-6]|uniref:DUF397 domain-containing protein n=1 Tax=Streptomyces sp. ME19-01-6 TaxID=3028686 RepID=UPI0029B53AB5|nr:DUF397 domain-containing protein [Streptomyces sp. ME19-01-6]MDX3233448.1 DUF397 domain-containing protein [Streptomyces sp. ME19-01-6]
MQNINAALSALHSEGAHWRKSSYSGGNDDCVEFAIVEVRIAVRDSKRPDLAYTSFTAAAWHEFVSAVTAGTLA